MFPLQFPREMKIKPEKHWRELWTALRLPAVGSAPWRAPSNKIKKWERSVLTSVAGSDSRLYSQKPLMLQSAIFPPVFFLILQSGWVGNFWVWTHYESFPLTHDIKKSDWPSYLIWLFFSTATIIPQETVSTFIKISSKYYIQFQFQELSRPSV